MRNDAYLESKVLSADPLQLIQMLYQGALDAIGDARRHLAAGDIRMRSDAIVKVSGIIAELGSSLNYAAGGDLSRRLAELYDYMQMRLLEANLKQSDALLAEVAGLVTTLLEAWGGIMVTEDQPGSVPEPVALGANPWSPNGGTELASAFHAVWTL